MLKFIFSLILGFAMTASVFANSVSASTPASAGAVGKSAAAVHTPVAPEESAQLLKMETAAASKPAVAVPAPVKTASVPAPSEKKEMQVQERRLMISAFWDHVDQILGWKGFEPWRLCSAGVGLLLAFGLAWIVKFLISRQYLTHLIFRKDFHVLTLVCQAIAGPAAWIVFLLIAFFSSYPVFSELPESDFAIVERVVLAAGAVALTIAFYKLVKLLEYFIEICLPPKETDMNILIVGVISKIVRTILLALAFFMICENILKLNVTALLAGAGVVGLAVAFAAQDTIANFFGSLILLFERPFKAGDFVKIDGQEGVVERVGLRSTTLRTLDDHLIVVPNKISCNTSIENVTIRKNIKKIATYGMVYDTPVEKMEEAVRILHGIFDAHEGMMPELPPKIFFSEFGDFSMNIQVILWYHPGNITMFNEWWSKMNFKVLRRFNEAGLEFAFPTNTTYLAYDPKRAFPPNPVQK